MKVDARTIKCLRDANPLPLERLHEGHLYRNYMNRKYANVLLDILERLARAYLADAGDDAPEATLARAILGEEGE